MKTLTIFLLSCLTLSAQVGLRSAGYVASAMKPVGAASTFTCNIWQDFEFDGTVDVTALATTDHATFTWQAVDTETKLSTSSSGELKALSDIKGDGDGGFTDDTGTRGLAVGVATTTEARISVILSATDTLSAGFWFKVPTMTGNRIFNVHAFRDTSTDRLRMITTLIGGNHVLRLTVGAGTEDVTVSANTWYWLTTKYVKSGACKAAIYSSTGALVANFSDQTDASGTTVNRAAFGLISGASAEAGTSLYFDDCCVDVDGSLFPVGP